MKGSGETQPDAAVVVAAWAVRFDCTFVHSRTNFQLFTLLVQPEHNCEYCNRTLRNYAG